MYRQFAKSLLFFSLGCLWVVESGESFAFSRDGTADTSSRFEIAEEVDLSNSDSDPILSAQFSFDFDQACVFIFTEYLCIAPLASVTHGIQSRGPPTSWL